MQSLRSAPASRPLRPPQVPKLDLSIIDRSASGGESGKLNSQHWAKLTKSGAQRPGPPEEDPAAQGFASASPEDQQRIAEYYGYRDEGFTTAMHGLRTDQIRPRLYVGSMADAAYWPHLKSLNVTHVVNCAVEAQKAPPPYESHGIKYHFVPLHDSPDEVQQLIHQRFRSLRVAARFVRDALEQRQGSVLLHCVQGRSRSAAVACAYLMECEDVSVERALAEVQSKHRGCLTSAHWQSLLVKLHSELLKGT